MSDFDYYGGRRHQRSVSRRRSRSRSGSGSSSPAPRHHSGRTSRDRQRMHKAREHPQASRCIGVFGLNTNTTQHKVRELFNKYGPIERIQMVIDAHTNRSRGFCFIYFDKLEDARVAKDACSGIEVDDRRIRVDYSITQRAHTPTPGVYMGRPSRIGQSRRSRSPRAGGRRRDRSGSPKDYYVRQRNDDRNDRYDRGHYTSSSRHRQKSYSRSRSPQPRRGSPRYLVRPAGNEATSLTRAPISALLDCVKRAAEEHTTEKLCFGETSHLWHLVGEQLTTRLISKFIIHPKPKLYLLVNHYCCCTKT
ncbi:transformer-2 sex-determining protein isoform X2 [Drosophila gunungcola]|uniref:transformer-2 sex-determining protein isoform X2 n=1 Tax=Drosophila gunungcola TaxID=103775 RepID=UPI0022E3FFA9|nr:transformer-2 sex-determining protein isoform X2 [Drosophila gunungcola]